MLLLPRMRSRLLRLARCRDQLLRALLLHGKRLIQLHRQPLLVLDDLDVLPLCGCLLLQPRKLLLHLLALRPQLLPLLLHLPELRCSLHHHPVVLQRSHSRADPAHLRLHARHALVGLGELGGGFRLDGPACRLDVQPRAHPVVLLLQHQPFRRLEADLELASLCIHDADIACKPALERRGHGPVEVPQPIRPRLGARCHRLDHTRSRFRGFFMARKAISVRRSVVVRR
mmetsp:Transcript_1483/g.3028  ORF Transcript_1483/g.3028 Transcript_1483/m.3028 type:complete len:229 (-) Transcript_1483:680-1366(-)